MVWRRILGEGTADTKAGRQERETAGSTILHRDWSIIKGSALVRSGFLTKNHRLDGL